MKTEANFVQHCDDECCDLGYFQYECPCCGSVINDYVIWWKQFDIHKGIIYDFKCEKCESKLYVMWDEDDFSYYVSQLNIIQWI